ncbi:MAG TPA: methyltransferase domain-containing protein [Gemmatimonadota bacterium]
MLRASSRVSLRRAPPAPAVLAAPDDRGEAPATAPFVGAVRAGEASDAARWSRFWRGRERPDEFYPPSPRIREHLLPHAVAGTRVLEVGAGSGRDGAALAARGARVVLLDASAGALELASRNAPGLRGRALVRGDALASPFPDGAFDLVFHQGLLEHFRDPLPLLLENRRLLRPGGVLLVDVPQTFHPWTALKRVLIPLGLWFAGWETQFTPAALERAVRAAGFERLTTYGDWMRPSLAYRLAREAAGKAGVRLPLHPPTLPLVRDLRGVVRGLVQRRRASLWVAHTVGIVARKPGG